MYINTKKTLSIKSIYTFLAVIVILLNSGYYRSTLTDSYVPLFLLIATAMIGVLFHLQQRTFPKVEWFSLVLVADIGLSILANFNKANLMSGARVAATLLCSGILASILPFQDFVKYFSLFIKFVILFSIALEILLLLGFGGMPTISGYYDLLIVTRKVSGDRLSGIFWEPGVFATMIIISMLLEYYFANQKIKLIGLIVYVCGVLGTRSTAGVILMLVVFFGLLWKGTGNRKRNPFYSVLFVISVVAIVVFYHEIVEFLVDLNPDLFGKLVETDSGTTSTRLNSPLINLRVFSKKPFFGWGFTDSSAEILELMPSTGSSKVIAQTSTSTQIMAAIGFLGVLYSLAFLLPIFSSKKHGHLPIELKIIAATCFLLMANKEPHLFIVCTWMVMFYINQPISILEKSDRKNHGGNQNEST